MDAEVHRVEHAEWSHAFIPPERCISLVEIIKCNQCQIHQFSHLGRLSSPMLRVTVALPSGQSESLLLAESSEIGDLRILAQKTFQQGRLRLATSEGRVLTDTESLQAAGIHEGDHLTAVVQQTKVAASSRAFALCCGDKTVTWGDSLCGGDSSEVQHQLKGVQQVQSTTAAFAAILADGSVVIWG